MTESWLQGRISRFYPYVIKVALKKAKCYPIHALRPEARLDKPAAHGSSVTRTAPDCCSGKANNITDVTQYQAAFLFSPVKLSEMKRLTKH